MNRCDLIASTGKQMLDGAETSEGTETGRRNRFAIKSREGKKCNKRKVNQSN